MSFGFAPDEVPRDLYAFRTPAGARGNRGRDRADLPLRRGGASLVAPVRGRVCGDGAARTRRVRARVLAGDDASGARARGRVECVAAAPALAPRLARTRGPRRA